MEVEWMNHTGFVVSDMERSLAFYRDLLGLKEERDQILEGEFISELVGYPDARLHIVYLGSGDMRHSVELIQYLNPPGTAVANAGAAPSGSFSLGCHSGRPGCVLRRAFEPWRPVRKPAGDTPRSGIPYGQQGLLHGRTPTATGWSCWSGRRHRKAPLKPDALRPVNGPCATA